jgi:hypothetical protein
MISRLTVLIVVTISLISAGCPLAAVAQETDVADIDTLQKNTTLPRVLNNEQNSILNQTDVLESSDSVDVISRQIAQLRTIHPETDIENLTPIEIGDLLELYGLDTDGPVCPPCPNEENTD